MKKLFRNFREIWHNIYFYKSGSAREKFALTCKQAADLSNGNLEKAAFSLRMRYRLHLSICQICKNYSEISSGLRQALRRLYSSETIKIKQMNTAEAEKLNTELLKKHSNKHY
ncbi:MAG: hypothetical protein ABL930_00145 [Pseudobdellovibrio sp.]